MFAAAAFVPEVPHGTRLEERWEILKPTIEFWYLDKNLSVAKLAKHMKENHGFDAFEHQYKFQFKKWGLKKNIRAKEKANIERAVMTRADLGRSTVVEYKGRKVDPEKLRRHAKNVKRKDMVLRDPDVGVGGSVVAEGKLSFGKNIFLNWFMPFEGLTDSPAGQFSHPSPFTHASPLEGFTMRTPSDGGTPSTTRRGQSQMTFDVMKRASIERAHWFMNGQHEKLLKSLTMPEARVMSTWLHQFWMFGFKTAKHWGFASGPWNAHELGFDEASVFGSLQSPNSHNLMGNSVEPTHGLSQGSLSAKSRITQPQQLCRWTVHIKEIRSFYSRTGQSPPPQPTWHDSPIQRTLRDALEHNDFTSIDPEQLPVAIPHVAKHTEKSPNELLLESFGFAIMSRNVDPVACLLSDICDNDVDILTIYPFHLAIDYLDGSKACCKILEILSDFFRESDFQTIRDLCVNESGYILTDSLMMAIIRSHTNLAPSVLDDTNKEKRFCGDEVSICGRWDADSDCIRELLSSGSSKVPPDWKHKFCHTSVQAVCHAMQSVLPWSNLRHAPPSGLFLKHCVECGLKLELSQFHTLVFVTYLLAGDGREDEDLFGMIACLLCLLFHTEDPTPKSEISIALLLNMVDEDYMMDGCTHQQFTPAEFARDLRSFRTCHWTKNCATGWELFQLLLDQSQQALVSAYEDPKAEEGDFGCYKHESTDILSLDPKLAKVWAGVQTEFLTYRRLNLTDPWMSNKFEIAGLLQSLKSGEELSFGLIDLMKEPACSCGHFAISRSGRVEEASTHEFSNFSYLDDPERTAYVLDV